MSKPSIKVTIAEDGSTTVAVDGVAGKSCKDMTAKLEKALGIVAATEKTADYNKVAKQGQTLTQ